MIVVDASAVVEVVCRTSRGRAVTERIFAAGETRHVPHLLDVEVGHTLRRLLRRGTIGPMRAREALADLADLDVVRYPHTDLMTRAWELSDNLSMYGAVYVALAETLESPMLTRDVRLASAPGHAVLVEVIA